jgi:biopolymer transport protein ExbB/TolQ
MEPFVQGWGLTIVLCAFIVLVFLAGWLHVHRELSWVRALTDYLGEGLVAGDAIDERSEMMGAGTRQIDERGEAKGAGTQPINAKSASLEVEAIRDEAHAISHARDPAWAQKQVRSWQMRAQRLEPALAFWTDLLRQLGLLGTVLGLGLSLAYTGSDLTKLLGPLAIKVWTTVAGLACSILLSASFSMRLTAWVDACEKNLEAWDARRRARTDSRDSRGAGPGYPGPGDARLALPDGSDPA